MGFWLYDIFFLLRNHDIDDEGRSGIIDSTKRMCVCAPAFFFVEFDGFLISFDFYA